MHLANRLLAVTSRPLCVCVWTCVFRALNFKCNDFNASIYRCVLTAHSDVEGKCYFKRSVHDFKILEQVLATLHR